VHLDSLSWHKTYRPFNRFIKPALDKSLNRDNLVVRRDWQKLRLAVLSVYWDFTILTTLSYHDNPYPFTEALISWQLYHTMSNPARLPGCFTETNLSYHDKSCPFTWTLPSWQQYSYKTTQAPLPGLCSQNNYFLKWQLPSILQDIILFNITIIIHQSHCTAIVPKAANIIIPFAHFAQGKDKFLITHIPISPFCSLHLRHDN
jgi:hypothetical protein